MSPRKTTAARLTTMERKGVAWLPCTVVTSSDPSEYKIAVDLPNFAIPMSAYVRRADVFLSTPLENVGPGWVRVSVVDRERQGNTEYIVIRFPGETLWRGPLTPVPPSYLAEKGRLEPAAVA